MSSLDLELLKKFCYKGYSTNEYFDVTEPWSTEKFTYVTDRRILLRVPRIKGVGCNKGTKPIRVETMFRGFPPKDMDGWIQPQNLIDAVCSYCKGKGYTEHIVPEEQRSQFFGFDSWDEECPKCTGNGVKLDRYDTHETGIRIGNHILNVVYLLKIMKLPGWEMAPEWVGYPAPIPIHFEGGTGLVMGMRQELDQTGKEPAND